MSKRSARWFGLLAVLTLPFLASLAKEPPDHARQSWRTAPSHSAGLAPDPRRHAAEAIVQVYAAPTYGWRRYFAVHPWIIYKRSGQTAYTRYEVIGWGGGDVIRRNRAVPDGLWFGARPERLVDLRGGAELDAVIARIEAAVASYPYPREYRIYPGPNSNTFLAHIGREVPELRLDLPANAIGKDYRPLTHPLGLSPSGVGVQASLLGLLGVTLGLEEGIELNLLGLNFGIDFARPALRLPSLGRLGLSNLAEADAPAP